MIEDLKLFPTIYFCLSVPSIDPLFSNALNHKILGVPSIQTFLEDYKSGEIAAKAFSITLARAIFYHSFERPT